MILVHWTWPERENETTHQMGFVFFVFFFGVCVWRGSGIITAPASSVVLPTADPHHAAFCDNIGTRRVPSNAVRWVSGISIPGRILIWGARLCCHFPLLGTVTTKPLPPTTKQLQQQWRDTNQVMRVLISRCDGRQREGLRSKLLKWCPRSLLLFKLAPPGYVRVGWIYNCGLDLPPSTGG